MIKKNSLINFWNVDSNTLKIKNLDNIRKYGKISNLEINNPELIPKWFNNKSKKIYINSISPTSLKNSDVTFDNFTLLKISDKIYVNNLDNIIEDILFERYFEKKQQLFSKFPFPYYFVPLDIRNNVFRLLNKLKKDPLWPEWPYDNSVDILRFIFLKSLELKLDKKINYQFWPQDKKSCLMISHDIETNSGYKNIESIREIEKNYEIKSSWNIVAKRGKIDFKKLKKLKEEGCEIGSQGYNHDGKLPYLEEEKIKKRINYCFKKLKDFELKGFRSPQLQRTEMFLKLLSNYFDYDSSIPDTEIYSPIAIRNGCCTVFPFFINNMVELPLTMPQDFFLIHIHKFDKNKILELWKNKIDYINKIGGLISFNMHPDSYISGNEKYLKIYEELLNYISKYDSWKALPHEVAEWWNLRQKES